MTKIIWVDLDEVLAETMDRILLDNNYKLWDKIVSRDDIMDYFFFNMDELNIPFEDWKNYFHNVCINDKDLEVKVVEWAKEKLQQFRDKWYKLNVITWRNQDVEDYTLQWIKKNYEWLFDTINFSNHFNYVDESRVKRNKSDICKELWVSFMIDDMFEYALDLAENWIVTYMIEKPWNKHITQTHPNIIRVKSWEEIII
jgi:hypothetical protein